MFLPNMLMKKRINLFYKDEHKNKIKLLVIIIKSFNLLLRTLTVTFHATVIN